MCSKRKAVPDLTQVQKPDSSFGNEATVSLDLPSHARSIDIVVDPRVDLKLPIAIRKGVRECTRRPLYPLSQCVSLKHLPSYKKYIVSLNTIFIPNTVSVALLKKEWRDVMEEEIRILEKNKHGRLLID